MQPGPIPERQRHGRLNRLRRGRLNRSDDAVSASIALEDAVCSVSGSALPYRLLGWGSNEFLQLSDQPAPAAVLDDGDQDTSLLFRTTYHLLFPSLL